MKKSLLFILLFGLSFFTYSQTTTSNNEIEKLTGEINTLKAANARLKNQLSESILVQDKKLNDLKGNLNLSENKLLTQSDSIKQFYKSLLYLRNYTYHKAARHRKIILYGYIWMLIGFVSLTLFIVMVFFIFRKRMIEKFQKQSERMVEVQELFNKQINLTNEAFNNKLEDISQNLLKQQDLLKTFLTSQVTELNQVIQNSENKLDLFKKQNQEQITIVKQDFENHFDQLKNSLEKNQTTLNQNLENKMNEIKKGFDSKVSDINNQLNKHTHQQ